MTKQADSDSVVWAYRLLLDREPENRQVVREWLTKSLDRRGLVQEFLNSPEFKFTHPRLRFPALSGFEPGMHVDLDLSAAEMESLFRHVQETWERLGREEPHYSVITSEFYKPSRIQGNLAEFYDTGRHECQRLLQTLARNGVDPSQLKTCLEFGCGVGRITRWLCGHFDMVYGCDISLAHLGIAREHFAAERIANAEFSHLRRVQDIHELPRVDLVYSILVLQHNPPPVMRQIIRGFLRALNPGGIAFFQVPTYRAGYVFRLQDYLGGDAREQKMEMHALPQRQVFEIAREEGGSVLEVIEDILTGMVACQELSNTFIIQKNAC